MSEAEAGATPEGSAATTQEPTIPKWRFDEMVAKIKAKDEELEIKNQLLNQTRQAPAKPEVTLEQEAEELGLDINTTKALHKIASRMVESQLKPMAGAVQGQLARVMNETEELKFLNLKGSDKSKYLEKIRVQRQKHWQQTGGYQSVEDAFKIVKFDEIMANEMSKPTETAPAAATKTEANAGASTTPPAAKPTQKSYAEMTFEEKEAYLDSQGGVI